MAAVIRKMPLFLSVIPGKCYWKRQVFKEKKTLCKTGKERFRREFLNFRFLDETE